MSTDPRLPQLLLRAAFAACVLAVPAVAQVVNDECDTALPLTLGLVPGDTDQATDSPETGSCASFGASFGNDVWFRYVAPQNGVLILSLVGGGGTADFDTVLAAFTGTCDALVEEACNDDAFPLLQSKLSVLVTQGEEYFIELGGWNGASGHFELAASFVPAAVPPNDTCATAQVVTDGLYSGATYFATTAPTTPSCAAFGAPVTNDVWFLYAAPTDGFLRASLVADGGSADFDTVMAAYTGQCGQLVQVACNDDGAGSLASDLVVPVAAGTSYRIEIGGWNGAVGEFTLSLGYVTLPSNDECATALPVGPGLIRGSTTLATTSPVTASCAFGGAPTGIDLWFDFTAPEAGALRVSTDPAGGGYADFDTVLAVFTGDCNQLEELECNDDASATSLQSELMFPIEAGETYHIEVGGFVDSAGSFGLNLDLLVQAPTPDVVLSHAKISDTAGGFQGDLSAGLASFGTGVAAVGDIDGDGTGDLAVGSPFENLLSPEAGALWLLLLNPDGSVKSHVRHAAGAGGLGFSTGQTQFGIGVAPLGDLDADGVPDLAVGADLDDDGGPDRGAVWILFLQADGAVKSSAKISATAGGFGGTIGNGSNFGRSLARVGDLDLDGVTELAVGAPETDDGGAGRGAVWVLFLNPDGTVDHWQRISDTIGLFTGPLSNADHFGQSVAGLGDLDGDGSADLAVGAPGDDDGGTDNGAVWVLRLQSTGKVSSWTKLSATSGGFDGQLFGGALFGQGLAALADADGDGRSELAVGSIADSDGGPFHGSVWLVFLDATGAARRTAKISSSHGGFGGVLGEGAFFGEALADLGDLDGDGLGDLAVGNRFDDDGASNRGAVWMLFLDAAYGWIDVGQALAGSQGPPRLEGEGALTPGGLVVLTIQRTLGSAPAAVFMGFSAAGLPFHGGVLVPAPEVVAWPLLTEPSGSLQVQGHWPGGMPAGVPVWFQAWMFDPAGPQGFAATNALLIETP